MHRLSGNALWLLLGAVIVACGGVASAIEYRYLMRIGGGDLLLYPIAEGGRWGNWAKRAPLAGRIATALQPLIDQKSSHGFSVTVIHLEDITSTVAGIRAAIQSWYSKGSASMDHYCLLVGDTNKIPLGSQSGIPTDDLYGSPSDGDLCEEVYVGRLSVDGITDVSNQVAKIENAANVTPSRRPALR
jgi:hypothetical protein